MSTITLESIEAKQTELQQLISKFKAEQPRTLAVSAASIVLATGELFAGLALGPDGKPSHYLIALPGDADDLTWEEAKAWAKEQGGELPTRQEQALLFANLKHHFQGAYYWSALEYESNASYAWIQGFDDGDQFYNHMYFQFRARAVRRLVIE